ncbi:MAG TPA: nucleotide exchange factor GrpE [Candidatus Acidoferrales bacterium]|nr:nucleotide exchange factor GrpE [Candidatus Acidoferrales bacterium]
MAEPKREEEKVIPIDGERGEREADASQVSGETSIGDPPEGGTAPASELEKLKAEKEELLQTMIRRQADFENFKKRTERDRLEEARRGVERLITDLIPVLDGFDRALQGHDDPAYEEYRKGVTLIRKQLWDAIARHGVQRIEAAGKLFDPHQHQAIERLESEEYPDGSIVAVFQDGYTFNGKVLRPAIVRVAVNAAEGADFKGSEN